MAEVEELREEWESGGGGEGEKGRGGEGEIRGVQ
jgi:hypothetical protein